MRPFERLLQGDGRALGQALERAGAGLPRDRDTRREQMAQRLGLNPVQLVCAAGFNPHTPALEGAAGLLGFAGYDALVDERNLLFINDRYEFLTIDNVIEIYRSVGQADAAIRAGFGDVVLSRLSQVESQIEATINPVMLSSYKLEIRGIYENKLASAELVALRLRPEYEVLRGVADEIIVLAHAGVVAPAELLRAPGVSPEEKSRLLFHELVSEAQVAEHLAGGGCSEREREVLAVALGRR